MWMLFFPYDGSLCKIYRICPSTFSHSKKHLLADLGMVCCSYICFAYNFVFFFLLSYVSNDSNVLYTHRSRSLGVTRVSLKSQRRKITTLCISIFASFFLLLVGLASIIVMLSHAIGVYSSNSNSNSNGSSNSITNNTSLAIMWLTCLVLKCKNRRKKTSYMAFAHFMAELESMFLSSF